MKKISVIITTHCRSNMLENAIKSVINQSYSNIEIIVIDDNADNLDERIKTRNIVKKYKNIILIENEKNLGGAISRNVGIKNSTGELLSFLDDDDIYMPNRIEKLNDIYEFHKNDNPGLIYCCCATYDKTGTIIGEWVHELEGKPFYNHMIDCIAGTSMWLVPKKVLENVGMFEDSPCKQDSIVILKIMSAGYNIFCTKEKLVLYFEHGGKGISGLKLKNIDGIKKYREWCRKNYNKNLNQKQIQNVENNFRYQIMKIYNHNGMKKEAKNEIKKIMKNSIGNKYFFKALLKFLFPKIKGIKKKNIDSNKKIDSQYQLNI